MRPLYAKRSWTGKRTFGYDAGMARKNPHAVAMGRKKSAKKTAAARKNGLLGGRPRKKRTAKKAVK